MRRDPNHGFDGGRDGPFAPRSARAAFAFWYRPRVEIPRTTPTKTSPPAHAARHASHEYPLGHAGSDVGAEVAARKFAASAITRPPRISGIQTPRNARTRGDIIAPSTG